MDLVALEEGWVGGDPDLRGPISAERVVGHQQHLELAAPREGDGGEEEEGVEAQGHRLGQGWKGAPTTNRVKYFGA